MPPRGCAASRALASPLPEATIGEQGC
jgi:hypothetical protein